MKKTDKKASGKRLTLAMLRPAFVGAKMSNFLYALAQRGDMPSEMRSEADTLRKQWDSVSAYRIHNPITAATMEAKLFSKAKGAGK